MGLKRKKRLLGILIFSLVIGMMGSAGGEAEAKKKIILNKKEKSRDLCWRSTSPKSKGNKEKGEVVFKGEKDCDSFKKRSC